MNKILRFTPDTPPAVIAEDEVTISRLASFLDAAFIDYTIDDDGDLYAKDGLEFPAWIDIDQDKKMIMFLTCISADEKVATDLMARVNEMNTSYVAVQFHLRGEVIWGHYWLSYDGGINVRQFIKMLRRFCSAFRAGIIDEKVGRAA
jgi:hypothetical protein